MDNSYVLIDEQGKSVLQGDVNTICGLAFEMAQEAYTAWNIKRVSRHWSDIDWGD